MHQYLTRIYATLYSRGDVEIQFLYSEQPTRLDGRVRGRLRFYDGSTLTFEEKVIKRGRSIEKISYRYHYQHADGTLGFRYDNAPHHPEVFTFPDHIHIEGRVEATEPPDLSEILRRIDGLLYPTGQQDGALNNQEYLETGR
ncbi:MAG: DUF6516 family protein [Anaerolineae bacterium]